MNHLPLCTKLTLMHVSRRIRTITLESASLRCIAIPTIYQWRSTTKRYENLGKILASIAPLIQIQEIDTNGYDIGDAEIKAIAVKLNRLRLRKSRHSEETLVYLVTQSPMLVDLNLSSCAFATDNVLRAIAKLECLQELDLSCLGASAFGKVGLDCLFRGAAMSTLIELSLTGCNTVTDDNMVTLSQHSQTLVRLNCSGCFNISDIGLKAILRIQTLKTLSVSFCWRITDDAWDLPGKHSRLECVEMQFCYQLSGRVVPHLARILLNGCKLNLANCEYVTAQDKKQLQFMGFYVE